MCFLLFRERFGFYHVDIKDPALPRTPKLSAEYFRQLLSTRELPQIKDRFMDPSVSNLLYKGATHL